MAEPRVPLLVKGDYTDTAFTTWRFMIRCSCWMSATLVSQTFLSSSSLQLFCLKNCSFFLSFFSSTVDYRVHKLSRTDYFIIILLKKCVNISTCLKICIPIINQFQFEPILGYKWIELEKFDKIDRSQMNNQTAHRKYFSTITTLFHSKKK